MAEDNADYTNLSFLTSLRTAPKKNERKPFSINSDLHQLDLLLKGSSAKTISSTSQPTTLDFSMTKRFVMSLISHYEDEDEAEKKWSSFMRSMTAPADFQKFVDSLKDIKGDDKTDEGKPNPESNGQQFKLEDSNGEQKGLKRARSFKKIQTVKIDLETRQTPMKSEERIRFDLLQIKNLLAKGEKLIRSH